MNLQGPGVAGLPQALYGSRVSKQMRIDAFRESGLFRDFLDDLPTPFTINLEDPVVKAKVLVEGIALEAMGQALGTGHQPGFAALAPDREDRAPLLNADVAGSEAQGLGDA